MDFTKTIAGLLIAACATLVACSLPVNENPEKSPTQQLVGDWSWIHNDTLCRESYVFRDDGSAAINAGGLLAENLYQVSGDMTKDGRRPLTLEPVRDSGGSPCSQAVAERARAPSTSYLVLNQDNELMLVCRSRTQDDCEGPFQRIRNADTAGAPNQPVAEGSWTLEQLEPAADAGNPRAQTALGISYWYGARGLSRDGEKAAYWLRKAATQGYGRAAESLGQMLENGIGVPLSVENKIEARHWYEIAAPQGLTTAQMGLAFMMQRGQGGPKDEAGAVYWYRKAADLGQAGAQAELALMYETGRGVEKDLAAAVLLYRRSAYQGDAFGLINLARLYETGAGVTRSDREAAVLTLMAAVQGVAQNMREMGLIYLEGRGLPQDREKARLWLGLAAKAGDGDAKAMLDSDRAAVPAAN